MNSAAAAAVCGLWCCTSVICLYLCVCRYSETADSTVNDDDDCFIRVSQHSGSNSMDAKNLAICWWPTLMWPEITSMDTMILTTRPLEELVQLLIEQNRFFFHAESEVT